MNLSSIVKLVTMVLAVGFLTTFLNGKVWAQSGSGSFDVTLEALEEITISEVRALDFGTILAPTDVPQTFTIAPNGSLSTSTPGNGKFITGQQQAGIIYVAGTDTKFFSVSGSPGPCNGFTGTVILESIQVLPTTGSLDRPVQLGGALVVHPGSNGSGNCTYTVTADYQ
jgi:hypothetical protein